MIHSNNHKKIAGFTLMETMLALFMLGTVVSAIIFIQNNSSNGVRQFSARLMNILQLKRLLTYISYERAQGKEVKEKKIQDEGSDLSYSIEKINKNSSLKDFKNIVIEQAQAQWQENNIKKQERMITFLFMPPKEKKE